MEVTIEITKFCPNKCKYCSTNASAAGEHLSFKDINKITRINISGGEPLAHPDFYKILQTCYGFTNNVWVYTNALKQIIYNTDVIDEIEVHANVCLVPGEKVYLPKI